MDGFRERPPRAVTPQKSERVEDSRRPPLALSEKKNGLPVIYKPRTREISSRYNTPVAPSSHIASRRSPSPNLTHKSNAQELLLPKRAQSAERRRSSNSLSSASSHPLTPFSLSTRPSTPACDSVTDMHATSRHLLSSRTPDCLWPSMRYLSLSSDMDSFSFIPVAQGEPGYKLKSFGNVVSDRKVTPLRRWENSDLSENARPVDQARWPGLRDRMFSSSNSLLITNLDIKANATSLPTPSKNISPNGIPDSHDLDNGHLRLKSQVERQVSLDGGWHLKHESSERAPSSTRPIRTERAVLRTKPSRTRSPPVPSYRHASPLNKTLSAPTSAFKVMNNSFLSLSAPSSNSSSTICGSCSTPSVLYYIAEAKKKKKSIKHIEEAHQLRLLHNRCLQWSFVNALVEKILSAQRITAENTLYYVWNVTSELRDPVLRKSMYVQHMKQEIKLSLVVNEQMEYLKEWPAVEGEHFNSLLGVIEALKSSTLQIPVTGGTRVDIDATRNAICSAVDIMQAMAFSICNLLSKVEQTSSLLSDLLAVARKERALMHECAELLTLAGVLQVQESSLSGYMMQLGNDLRT